MIMTSLALSGVRRRTGAFAATFLSATLGAAILMTFAALLDTAAGATDTVSRDSLITMASVAGGWCLLIVVFAVSSTMSLSVRQRSPEMGVLRRAGATPGQLTRRAPGRSRCRRTRPARTAGSVRPGWQVPRCARWARPESS